MKTLETINIRQGTAEDIPALVKLFNRNYKRQKTAGYFRWQFFNSAYPTLLILACNDRQVVGMFGLQTRMLKSRLRVGQAIDMLIDENYRCKGLFRKLADSATALCGEIDALIVLPNLSGRFAVEKRLGWKTVGMVPALVMESKNDLEIDNKKIISDVGQIQPTFEEFMYTDETYKWRFDEHPDYSYTRITLDNDCFAYTKHFTDPDSGNVFSDIMYIGGCLKTNADLARVLIKCCHDLNRDGVSGLTLWALPETPPYLIARQLGFKERTQPRFLCCKSLNQNSKHLEQIESWCIFLSDAEFS